MGREHNKNIRAIQVKNRWCVHSYYTLCPYAPDGSGRILLAGADLDKNQGEVLILSEAGEVLESFGENKIDSGFFHTGFWQTWSPDARYVYYQSGSLKEPKIARRELTTGKEIIIPGDMEGAPPTGEPILSGLLGMLYAAGYGDGIYHAERAPVPFQHRREHGIFEHCLDPVKSRLIVSVHEILEKHPKRNQIWKAEKELKVRLGEQEGVTLMAYCVRWNPTGDRFLFYFGNHCVAKDRGEPKLAYVFTADREWKDIHLAVDLSFGKPGVHWSWHPDGEHLVGYGPDPEAEGVMCLAQVRFDGSGYKKISSHHSGGHPSISPANHDVLVTDTWGRPGEVSLIDVRSGEEIEKYHFMSTAFDTVPKGRNPYRVCHHPVFRQDGKKILVNSMPDRYATVCEIDLS